MILDSCFDWEHVEPDSELEPGYTFSLVRYRDDLYKIMAFRKPDSSGPKREKHEAGARLRNNLIRARSTVKALALCNDWERFGTFTLDPQRWNRKDLEGFQKAFSQMIRHCRRDTGASLSYVLVPEPHKDGSWHMHGLIGSAGPALAPFDWSKPMPSAMLQSKAKGRDPQNWPYYSNRFGFCSLEKVSNRDASALYLTKYITKWQAWAEETGQKTLPPGAHVFYASLGLKRPVSLGEMDFPPALVAPGGMSWDVVSCFASADWSLDVSGVFVQLKPEVVSGKPYGNSYKYSPDCDSASAYAGPLDGLYPDEITTVFRSASRQIYDLKHRLGQRVLPEYTPH